MLHCDASHQLRQEMATLMWCSLMETWDHLLALLASFSGHCLVSTSARLISPRQASLFAAPCVCVRVRVCVRVCVCVHVCVYVCVVLETNSNAGRNKKGEVSPKKAE